MFEAINHSINKAFLVAFICALQVGCAIRTHSVKELVAVQDAWDKKSVLATGYLCLDFATAYLSSSDNCDDLENGIKMPLVLSAELWKQARSLGSGNRVTVDGIFHAPPKGAVRMIEGNLQGTYMEVSSMDKN